MPAFWHQMLLVGFACLLGARAEESEEAPAEAPNYVIGTYGQSCNTECLHLGGCIGVFPVGQSATRAAFQAAGYDCGSMMGDGTDYAPRIRNGKCLWPQKDNGNQCSDFTSGERNLCPCKAENCDEQKRTTASPNYPQCSTSDCAQMCNHEGQWGCGIQSSHGCDCTGCNGCSSCERIDARIISDIKTCGQYPKDVDISFCRHFASMTKFEPNTCPEPYVEICEGAHLMEFAANKIFELSLADMIIEIVSVFVIVAFAIAMIYELHDVATVLLVAEMACFVVDVGLQIAQLAYANNGGLDFADKLTKANCMDRQGLDIIVSYAQSVKQVIQLGWIELVFAVITAAIDTKTLYTDLIKGKANRLIENSMPTRMTSLNRGFVVALGFFNCVLTTVDFAVFSVEAKTKAEQLFGSLRGGASDGEIKWCTAFPSCSKY